MVADERGRWAWAGIVHDGIGVSGPGHERQLRLPSPLSGRGQSPVTGLRAGLSVYSADLNDLVYWDGGDQV